VNAYERKAGTVYLHVNWLIIDHIHVVYEYNLRSCDRRHETSNECCKEQRCSVLVVRPHIAALASNRPIGILLQTE